MKKLSTLWLYILFLIPIASNAQNIVTVAGTGVNGFNGDNLHATATNIAPLYLAVDAAGYLYIGEKRRIRKVGFGGIVTTIAGTGEDGYDGDGGPATAAKIGVEGITIDRYGNIYLSDWYSNTIRKVNTLGIISKVAGIGGAPGYSGDGGPATAAKLNLPSGVAVDTSGTIYFTDYYNHCIRKINTAGIISTIAGTPTISGYSGDGGLATAAKMRLPFYMSLGSDGNIYCPELGNEVVRKINFSTGLISTVAGVAGVSGYSGDGGPATNAHFTHPNSVTTDSTGNLYIADAFAHVVRKVDIFGVITTIAGTGIAGFSGDGGPAISAQLNKPQSVAVDKYGNVYIHDEENRRVRRINYNTSNVADIATKLHDALIIPNPSEKAISINAGYSINELSVVDVLGKVVLHHQSGSPFSSGQKEVILDVSTLSVGLYFVKINGVFVGRFVKK
jgi:hypothetical protein